MAKVLVVDDNAENRALARATLEDEDYEVVLATGGEDGVAAFGRERPDCVLLDVRMPGVDGPTACARIRALPGGTEVPIVFVTALRDLDTFDRSIAAGADDFMTKPYRPSELLVRVEAALKLRRLASERSELFAEVKHQREELQRLQFHREQVMAFLVHDLKNPVNGIDLHAQLLTRDTGMSERSRKAAASIRQDARSLLRMITSLLDIAKANAGQLAPQRVTIEVSPLVRAVVGEMDVHARAAGVELVSRIDAEHMHGDPDLLRRVLENLVENAIRHAPEGSQVQIAIAPKDGGVELRVADAGTGVPADQRDLVFEQFVSRGAGTNRGLGLSFCKLAVEAHGGRIWIEDAAPGAAFCVWIEHAR